MAKSRVTFFTFYSFKGGVGRTQTLANVAVALANLGRKVLMIDFDLESPGLHRYFAPKSDPFRTLRESDLNSQGGLLDWLERACDVPNEEPSILDYVLKVTCPAHRPESQGSLELIACGSWSPPGRPSYSQRILAFNWSEFLENRFGEDYLENLRSQLERSGAEIVLIDSRTGMTDVGLLCTFTLPDHLVLLFGLHEQGIQGAKRLAKTILTRRQTIREKYGDQPVDQQPRVPQQVLLLPSRIDEDQEIDLRDKWIARAREELSSLGTWLGEYGQRLPYLAKAAFGENILVSSAHEPTDLSRTLLSLASRLNQLSSERSPAAFHPELAGQSQTLPDLEREFSAISATWHQVQAGLDRLRIPTSQESFPEFVALVDRLDRERGGFITQLIGFLARLQQFGLRCGVLQPRLSAHSLESIDELVTSVQLIRNMLGQVAGVISSRRDELRQRLTQISDEPDRVTQAMEALEALLQEGDWEQLDREERLQREQLEQSSLLGRLRRNRLELNDLRARLFSEEAARRWIQERITGIQEGLLEDPSEDKLRLRNLLRIYPHQPGRPPQMIWESWDTLCLLYLTPWNATLQKESDRILFQEIGQELWRREWHGLLDEVSGQGPVVPVQAGLEARRQLERIIHPEPQLLEPILHFLIDQLGPLVKGDKDFSAVRTILSVAGKDRLFERLVTILCRESMHTTPRPDWRLPLIAETLLRRDSESAELWALWLELLVQKGLEREAFFAFVALTRRGTGRSSNHRIFVELPVLHLISLAEGSQKDHDDARQWISQVEILHWLGDTPAGKLLLTQLLTTQEVSALANLRPPLLKTLTDNSTWPDLLGPLAHLNEMWAHPGRILRISRLEWSTVAQLRELFGSLATLRNKSFGKNWAPMVYYQKSFSDYFEHAAQQVSSAKDAGSFDVQEFDAWLNSTHIQYTQVFGYRGTPPNTAARNQLARAFEQARDTVLKLRQICIALGVDLHAHLIDADSLKLWGETARKWLHDHEDISPPLWLRLTGEESGVSATSARSSAAPTSPVKSPDLPLAGHQLRLSPVLLGLEEDSFDVPSESYLRNLLEYSAGQRSWESVGKALLQQQQLGRLLTLLLEARGEAPETLRHFQAFWSKQRKEALELKNQSETELTQLNSRGLSSTEGDEVRAALELLYDAITALPDETTPEFLEKVKASCEQLINSLRQAEEQVHEQRSRAKARLQERQNQLLKDVKNLRNSIDARITDLELLDDNDTELITWLRSQATEGMRQRDLKRLEQLHFMLQTADNDSSTLQRMRAETLKMDDKFDGENAPHFSSSTLRVAATGLATSLSDTQLFRTASYSNTRERLELLSPERIANYWKTVPETLRRELNEAQKKRKDSSQAVSSKSSAPRLDPSRVEEPDFRVWSLNAAAQYLNTRDGLEPLGCWLLSRGLKGLREGQLDRLSEVLTEACVIFELQGLKLPFHERWRTLAWNSLLHGMLILYSGEQLSAIDVQGFCTTPLEEILVRLEQKELAHELAVPLLQIGLRHDAAEALERFLPWLSLRPLTAIQLIESLWDEASLLARVPLLSVQPVPMSHLVFAPVVALRLSLKLLTRLELLPKSTIDNLSPNANEVEQEALRSGRDAQKLSTAVSERLKSVVESLKQLTDSVGSAILVPALQRLNETIEHPSQEIPKLSHRLLTRDWVHADNHAAFVVLELHYHKGFGTLRDLQIDAVLLDAQGRNVSGGLGVVPRIPRLRIGAVQEVRLPISSGLSHGENPKTIQVDLRALRWDLISVPIELRVRQLNFNESEGDDRQVRTDTQVPVQNPFIVGRPVQKSDQIFGRDEQVDQIRQALVGAHQDQVVLVIGERRIGKTSLLNKFKQQADVQSRYLTLNLDLEGLDFHESPAAFYRERFMMPITRFLVRSGVKECVPTAELVSRPGIAFREWMTELDGRLERQKKRLLLIIDELERLYEVIERNESSGETQGRLSRTTAAELREVLQTTTRVSFVLSGVTPVLRRFTSLPGERLFKLAIEVECRPLSVEAATELVCRPARDQYEVLQLGFQHLIRETGRQPYLIQQVCFYLFNYMTKSGLTTATRSHIEEVLTREIIPKASVFAYLRADTPDPLDFLIVKSISLFQQGNSYVPLEALLTQLQRMGSRLSYDDVFQRLKRLERDAPQVLERKVGTAESFRLTVGLYARHLRSIVRDEGIR